MANTVWLHEFETDIATPVSNEPTYAGFKIMYGEALCHRISVAVTNAGQDVSFSGASAAIYVKLRSGGLVIHEATIDGNTLYADLYAEASAIVGRAYIFATATIGGITKAVLNKYTDIVDGPSGDVIDPGTALPNINALLKAVADVTAALNANADPLPAVRYDAAQSLNDTQKAQARTNIGAVQPGTISALTFGGMVSGGVVSAQATPGQAVAVSAGSAVTETGKLLTINADADLAADAADATQPRIDIVYAPDGDGAVDPVYLAGTAAASPAQPDTPEGGTLLAAIWRAANDNTISNDVITDKKTYIQTRDRSYIVGMEYLAHYHNLIRGNSAAKIILSGDSTTEGTGITDASYLLDALTVKYLVSKGITNTTVVNAGHGGATTVQWESTYLATDLAASPDLYIMRWGINDGGGSLPGRLATFETALRDGLATVRAAHDVNALSIMLMMPNSICDIDGGRDYAWMQELYPVILRAARDYQCCFVDTFHAMQDSDSVTWLDSYNVHPLEVGNAWIVSLISGCLAPETMRNYGVYAPPSGYATKAVSDLPGTYPVGLSVYRVPSGFPFDGSVVTIRSADGVAFQTNHGYVTADAARYAWRIGVSAWEAWQYVGKPEAKIALTGANSWTNYGGDFVTGRYWKDSDNRVHIEAFVKDGTTTQWTDIFTALPAGYRRATSDIYPCVCDTGHAGVYIGTSGEIRVYNVPSNGLLSINISYDAEQ